MKRLIIITIWFLSLSVQAQLPVYLDATKPFEERVDDMLQRMTAAEKQTLASTCVNLRSSGVPRLGIQPFVADTLPHAGMPSFAALTASWNPDLARQLGHTVAEQARYNRIDARAVILKRFQPGSDFADSISDLVIMRPFGFMVNCFHTTGDSPQR